jgi:hypothetical protein
MMLMYLGDCCKKISGPQKTVQIEESKFGQHKYHTDHPVKGEWVFGSVEHESGRTFLIPISDRSADTLMNVIDA